MNTANLSLFGRTKALEHKLDEFLDVLSECNIQFKAAITYFLEAGGNNAAAFQQKVKEVSTMESRGDDLRRTIEAELYEQALIPDFRGDVLSLLEDLDTLINMFEDNLINFAIENPQFPAELHKELKLLCEQVALSVESCVMSTRAFFRDINAVRDHSHKVMLYEKEADKLSIALKTAIFKIDLGLDQKAHLRNFVDKIDQLADEAEDVCDLLAIYTIKRAA
ncbi:MAG: DUF47 family protein [Magnetococcales bacterium]|nr:DUF47 family protein [Magnetococcales bacterium]